VILLIGRLMGTEGLALLFRCECTKMMLGIALKAKKVGNVRHQMEVP
jgi:hypothetical protein